jgi:hypothetical protein
VIGRGVPQAHPPEARVHEHLGLTDWQVEDNTEHQGRFDRDIGVLLLPSARADAHGLPGGDRGQRHPHGNVSALNQGAIEGGPVRDQAFGLARRMDSRLHPLSVLAVNTIERTSLPLEPSRQRIHAPTPCNGGCAAADCSVSTIARPREVRPTNRTLRRTPSSRKAVQNY